MKKILFFATIAIITFGSCGKTGVPSRDLSTGLDTVSYEIGVANSQGAKMYLAQMGIDTAYIDEYFKGFADAALSSEDKKRAAYFAGVQAGSQLGSQVYPAVNSQLFGADSTSTQRANLEQMVAGFIDGVKGQSAIPIDVIRNELDKRVMAYRDNYLMKSYGDNKKKSEEFIAKKAKEEGIEKLPGGTLYKVLTPGNGPIPKPGDKVQVSYEGRLVDGTVFESSDKINDGKPTEIMIDQVIPGWKEALAKMNEGSTWELYIPYDQAYGNLDKSVIKPYSALIFKLTLVKAKSDVTAPTR